MKALNLSIVVVVMALISACAVRILMFGAESKESNVKIITALMRDHRELAAAAIPAIPEAEASATSTIPCTRSGLSQFPANDSIVDFLKSEGLQSSFDARADLAAKAGMSEYDGSDEENIRIVNDVLRTTMLYSVCVAK